MARIGLVAGYGKLPIIFAKVARQKGDTVIAFALKGVTEPALEGYVDKIHWLNWGSLKAALLLLVTERIRRIIMLGKIKKEILFKNDAKLDDEAKKMLGGVKDKKDYAILNEVTKVLAKLGVEVIDSTTYLKDLIPSKGTLTKREPTADEWQDIRYAKEAAGELSRFDIGQTVVAKDRTIIALEAMEGTDEVIKRAANLVEGGLVVVKVARPDQDMRFDVPLVGLDTLKALVEARGKVLALEERRTLLIDREEVIRLADEKDISVVII